MPETQSLLIRWMTKFGWAVVVIAALTISTWSLFWVGRHYGLPPEVAALVSACFDGAALVSADLALRYARTHGDSGLGARVSVFTFAGASAWLNSQHAALAHDPPAARIMFAFPPLAAVVIFELHDRWERRGALRAAGRVPAALPVFGRHAWLLFPLRTLRTVRRIVALRLEYAENAVRTGQVAEPVRPVARKQQHVRDQSPDGSPESSDQTEPDGESPAEPSTRVVRAWAKTRGIQVAESGPLAGSVYEAHHAETGAGTIPASIPDQLPGFGRPELQSVNGSSNGTGR